MNRTPSHNKTTNYFYSLYFVADFSSTVIQTVHFSIIILICTILNNYPDHKCNMIVIFALHFCQKAIKQA